MSYGKSASFLTRVVQYLSENKLLTGALILVYSFCILFFHQEVATEAVKIKNNLGVEAFNRNVQLIGFIVLFVYLIFVGFALYFAQERKRKAAYLIITLLLIILHALLMFELNIEIIHALEFGLLAFLIFPLTRRFGAAIIYSVPVMFFDEWLQYSVWYPGYVEYFEFNDIVLDILGAGFMMVTLYIGGVKPKGKNIALFNRTEIRVLGIFILLIALSMVTCILAPFKSGECGHTLLVLNHLENPSDFWQIHPHHQTRYHVMKPGEGLIVIALTCLFYAGLDINKQPYKSDF
ncbi:MAG: VanZ family protein [Flavobacteriales bacterium]|nr:VanZ family protein [Flavobacteriales bacterium]